MTENNYTLEKLSLLFKQAFQHVKNADYSSAEDNYQKILNVIPDHADSLNYMGTVKHLKGDNLEALEYLLAAAKYAPMDAEVFYNLGCVYQALSQWENAKIAFQRAISIKPDYAMAHNNLSIVFVSLQDFTKQAYHVNKAFSFAPEELEIIVNYATFLTGQNHFSKAIELFKKAVTINPELQKANASLCHAYYKIGRHEEGLQYLKKITFTPDNITADSSSFLFLYNYEPRATPDEVFKAHKDWGSAIVKKVASNNLSKRLRRKNSPKLRIGYVSPNYSKHPVPYFLEPILENHDRSKFELLAYSKVRKADQITEKLKIYFTLWRDIIDLNNDDLYNLIVEDEIDILVDLAGHSSEHSLAVFARKPAPIQITYLGYPNTTGLPNMDYRITDEWCDPPGITDKWHTEKLIRIKTGFLCYKPRENCPAVGPLPFLNNGYITFGCFNNPLKINNDVITVWGKILNRVPDSKLILKDKIYSNEDIYKITLERLNQFGIPAERVALFTNIKDDYEAMDFYNKIDIALDAFPYNGTTTTTEALWMGAPVIALAGETHVSRVSYSILSQIGASELTAFNKDEYINIAVKLANNPNQLLELRNQLRNMCQTSTLTNGKQFTQSLETIYRNLWNSKNIE